MNAIEQQQPEIVEEKKQIYLQRVNKLYTEIKKWLKDESLVLEDGEIDIIEALGHYKVSLLSIKTPDGEVLAEFRPTGASVLGAEGLIMVEGWLDKGYVLYLLKNGSYNLSEGIEADGWYWEEQRLNTTSHLLNKTWLLQLITYVSDYEF